ncbi:hypothetical protein M8J76_002134 [Diaphorina citri]|nr:hypothetical protein M8J75_006890 [Diaphorina citri]KAI5736322.1 hypothetical protein M8J76_002134 [Diaphorina citri]
MSLRPPKCRVSLPRLPPSIPNTIAPAKSLCLYFSIPPLDRLPVFSNGDGFLPDDFFPLRRGVPTLRIPPRQISRLDIKFYEERKLARYIRRMVVVVGEVQVVEEK